MAQSILTPSPDMAHSPMQQALQAWSAGRQHEAGVLAQQVLSMQPDHVQALNLAGCSALAQGDAAQALKFLWRAQALVPQDVGIQTNLAWAQLHGGDVEPALRRAAHVAVLDPQGQGLMQALQQAWRQRVRPSALAGRFFAADAGDLARNVDDDLSQAAAVVQPGSGPQPKILVLPHAGHVYSGRVAAAGYALLQPHLNHIRKVVILGPNHRVAVDGVALPGVACFSTPLGWVEVDALAAHALSDLPFVRTFPQAHAQEHCLEVHLPFIQRLWQGLEWPRVLPLLVGRVAPEDLVKLLGRLWGGADTLIIISTDLSHFHGYDDARRIDGVTCQQIAALASHLNHQQACGATPLNAALSLARQRGLSLTRLAHCNSGDTAGNTPEGRQRVVGYASFALYENPAPSVVAHPLTPDVGDRLLQLARHALHRAVGAADVPAPSVQGLEHWGASFVTLNQGGRLRGCIGSLQAHRPLHLDVQANAQAAALKDPRFSPVQPDEAADLQLEVSLLTPAQDLVFANESHALWQLQPHVHGVIWQVVHQGRVFRSTFLPQVWSQMPDPRVFLAQLKRKAGLPADFWSPDVQLATYTVQKFHETNSRTWP